MTRTPFGRFLLGRVVSLAGSAMAPVALSLAVLQHSHRASDLGVVLAARVGAHLSLLLLGGALGDRMSRRALLVGANLGAGLTQGAVAAVLLTGGYQLVLIAGLEFINGAVEALASPALRGIVPELVEDPDLPRANAVLTTVKNLTKVLGPATAGAIAVMGGGGIAIAIDAASFFVAAAILAGLTLLPTEAVGQSGSGLFGEIRQGWQTFRVTRWLWVTTAAFAVINLVGTGSWQILGPELVTEQSNDAVWGLALSARGVGALVMGILLYRYTPRHLLRWGQFLAVLGAAGLVALGLHLAVPWFVLCTFISGIGFAAPQIAWDTSVHQHISRRELSRISATNDLLSYTCVPVGQLLVGPFAAALGPATLALYAGLGFAAAALAPLASRAVRELTQPAI